MAAINVPGGVRGLPVPVIGPVNWWIVAGVLVFAAGALSPVLQHSTATSRSFDMQQLQQEQVQLQSDIKLIESDIANLTSLSRIEQRAAAIGLGPGVDPIYINIDVPGPQPAKVPSKYLPEPAP